jgi:hypothetical protein
MSSPCAICGQEVCEHLRPPFGPIRLKPCGMTAEEFVEWLRRNGFPGAHLDRMDTTFQQELIEVKPYDMPTTSIFFMEPPQFVPSIPYIPVPPMLIVAPDGTPLHTLRPDGTIWHDGDEYASGDPW